MTAAEIQRELDELGNPKVATFLQRFFKTGPGEYGEGDRFRGIRVPILRRLAGGYKNLPLTETLKLLRSRQHEDRLLALLILVGKFTNSDDEVQAKIYDLYLRNTRFINSWDLVDVSAPVIVGGYLEDKDREVLERLARSNDLWERRIAVISTFAFIKRGHVSETLKISRILLSDTEDLIHKAVGWMLREVGKQDPKAALKFLSRYHTFMPRTMLRYAIERLPEAQRRSYLKR